MKIQMMMMNMTQKMKKNLDSKLPNKHLLLSQKLQSKVLKMREIKMRVRIPNMIKDISNKILLIVRKVCIFN